ncbi:MAG: DUF3334 family protein [Caldimicrobium sp.]
MPERRKSTINELSEILAEATKEVLVSNTSLEIKYSPTLQKINFVSLRPDIGAFIEFNGDYNGLLCMNFSKEAAYELYTSAMKFMGIPDEEIIKDPYSEEIVNFLGEMLNQTIGNFRRKIENKYGLSAKNNQPRAITISHTITMYINTFLNTSQARKISFKTPSGHSFYAELTLEQTEFISFKAGEEEDTKVEDLLKEFF